MSHQSVSPVKRRTIRDIAVQKGGDPIVCLTAYTAPVARAADEYCDLLLVGDSLGMVLYGMDSTVPVSLDLMVNHGRAVVQVTKRALVVVDMPFGSYQESSAQAFKNAARILKETGAAAVKIEGGSEMADTVSFLTERGVPVLGHIGLQPQSVHATGGYRVMGRNESEQTKIINDAAALETAGAFGVVLECLDPALADAITQQIRIPTIGIGASAGCDGQILVAEDMAGMTGSAVPKFVKQYASVYNDLERAFGQYAKDVKERAFPDRDHIYKSLKK